MTDSARSGKIGDAYVPGPGASPLLVPGVRALLVTPRVSTRFEQQDGGSPMPTDIAEDPLELLVGSTRSFEVLIKNENGDPADLTGATEVSFAVKKYITDPASPILLRRATDANLTVSIPLAKLTCTLTQPEADALPPGGPYVAQVSVKFGSVWRLTKYFYVVILPSFAPQTP